MTLAAVAVVPAAPLLVPGVSAALPDGVGEVCDAVDAVLERLPTADGVVLVAAGDVWALYATADADLGGIGCADVRRRGHLHEALLQRVTAALDRPVVDGPLPLDLAVLVLLLGDGPPLVALSVPCGATFSELVRAGTRLADALAGDGERVVVVAAGDLSAGLDERSPLHRVEGAAEFDARVVEGVDAGRLDVLGTLGGDEARRVGARGWAPLALLHGVCERSKVGLVRRLYTAPRGVGYLVAYGA